MPTADGERDTSRGLPFSQLLYPSHEPLYSSSGSDAIPIQDSVETRDSVVNSICDAFDITRETYMFLYGSPVCSLG
jgi:hypothetical protein